MGIGESGEVGTTGHGDNHPRLVPYLSLATYFKLLRYLTSVGKVP